MSKDPAFLFYSQDFYTGTRLMTPNERACYIDLLIYQHQNEYLPNNLDRILMFCNGIDKATLEATLKAKFKQCEKGWYNVRLKNVIEDRQNYTAKQSENGKIGQLMKKAKAKINAVEFEKFKDYCYNTIGKEALIEIISKEENIENTLKGLLIASLKHLEDVNKDEDEIKNKDRNKDKPKTEKNKKLYGEFENVKLTDLEYEKSLAKYGDNLPAMIEILSRYIATKGDKYKSHYAAFSTWVENAALEQKQKTENKTEPVKLNFERAI